MTIYDLQQGRDYIMFVHVGKVDLYSRTLRCFLQKCCQHKRRCIQVMCVFFIGQFFISSCIYTVGLLASKCGLEPFRSGPCFNDSRNHDYVYLIEEPEICSSTKADVFLLIMVPSSPGEFVERQTIRETWGSISSSHSHVRLVFILGYLPGGVHQLQIHEESYRHHDVIQKNFIDSYKNLSVKSEAILHFAAEYCPSAKYLLKSDSDMFINVPYLLEVLHQLDHASPIILGHVFSAVNLVANRSSKWYISEVNFPLTYYPDYVSGTAYVISGKITHELFATALTIKYFELEDIFITGMCREKLGVRLIHNGGFSFEKPLVNICSFSNSISGHHYSPGDLREIWRQFKSGKVCSTSWFYSLF